MSAWMSGAMASAMASSSAAHGLGELLVALGAAAEQQQEGVPVVGHPAEVGEEAPLDLGVRRAGLDRGLADGVAQPAADLLEQGQVQLPLRAEVLVQHGLGDAGGVGHVVHGRAVEALAGEDLQRDSQELLPAGGGGKAGRHGYPMVTVASDALAPRSSRSAAFTA